MFTYTYKCPRLESLFQDKVISCLAAWDHESGGWGGGREEGFLQLTSVLIAAKLY